MARKVKCFITCSNEGQGAYGITSDSEENLYIPLSINEHMSLEEFETIEAIIVKNDRPEPAWKAIRVRRVEGQEPAV